MSDRGERLLTRSTRWGARALFRFPTGLPLPWALKRRWTELLAMSARVPGGLDRSSGNVGGVATERLAPHGAGENSILYLHGGAYVQGSPRVQRVAAARLALGAGATAFAPDYRLAPEHRFPAAFDDCLAAYRELAERGSGGRIAIAGDSAGGGLALAVALAARDADLPAPAGLFLICPWVDLGADRSRGRDADPVLARSFLAAGAREYLDGADPADPRCSPVNGELAGLPPILVHTADEDPLLPDAEALAAAAMDAGVEIELARFPLWHDFHLHAGILRAADDALGQGAAFLRSCLGRPTRPRAAEAPARAARRGASPW